MESKATAGDYVMGLFTALKQANDNRDIDALMSLYDDILVEHSVMRFKDGARESLISVKMLENGLVIRTETGASLMN
jgi:hypothetical protein